MKPYQTETVRLFNRLYNSKLFFWYGLPMQLITNGNNLHIKKSGKLAHTMIPFVHSFVGVMLLGFAILVIMRNPVLTAFDLFMIMGLRWSIVMYGIYFFLFLMQLLGYNDIMMSICNLTDQYVEQLGESVPAQRKIIRRPDLLNYTLRLLVWVGYVVPPPVIMILSLLGTGPNMILASFIDSKFSWIILEMDLFRCFIFLAIVAIMAVQFYTNIIDLADAYCDRVQSHGKQGDMQHFKVHQHVMILCRLAAEINRLGSCIGITIVGAFFVGFVYVVVRMRSIMPTTFVLLCVLGIFITGYVQLVTCNYSAYIDDKGKMLLQKYKEGLATVENVRKRKEMDSFNRGSLILGSSSFRSLSVEEADFERRGDFLPETSFRHH
ncbi:hypothetical protein Fcan01_18012 [Folsomia candida]|uniref:Uncharacterized protein n=1 Tax=Folsomia candida TaxID=158441 RepID=A0A226DT64_FOLCA|nr:hypothetical protein Fcan01_18012 [Folsomia candida]